MYVVLEDSEMGDMVKWTESFLRELLDLPSDFALQIKRAHRSLQQKPTEVEAPPLSLIARFVNHQHMQQVLAKAWNTANLRYNGRSTWTMITHQLYRREDANKLTSKNK